MPSEITTGDQITTETKTKNESRHHVKWGAVIKGVAIVTAVVVAAAVGYWGLSSLAHMAMANPGFQGFTASVLVPAWNAVTNSLAWLGNYLMGVPAMIGNFLGGAMHTLGFTGFGAATLAPTVAPAVTHTAGALGLGVAGLGATALAMPHLQDLHLFDHTSATVTQTFQHHDFVPPPPSEHFHDLAQVQAPAPEPQHDGNFLSNLFTSKTAAAHASLADSAANHEANAAASEHANQAVEHVSHHALHETQHGHEVHDGDHFSAIAEAKRKRAGSWREQVGGGNAPGSFTDAALAAKSARNEALAPRSGDFAEAIEQKRAQDGLKPNELV